MIIDGKTCAKELLEKAKKQIAPLSRKPKIVFLLVGENPASQLYIKMKQKTCNQLSISSQILTFAEKVSEKKLLETIHLLNQDDTVDAILVQMPLPPSLSPFPIFEAIDPCKDVDGFHPNNMGKLLQGNEAGIVPCTPLGIQYLLANYQIDLSQKQVVIIGRSNIVGKPLAALLMQKKPKANATVTIAHSATPHLSELTRFADVLIAAIGKPHFIQASMIKKGAVVIDVGISQMQKRTQGVKIIGDVNFEEVKPLASWITPVPGGVGPMTIAMLIQNTLNCYHLRTKKNPL